MKKGWQLFISFLIASFIAGPLGETVSLGIAPSQNTGIWVVILWIAAYLVLGAIFKRNPDGKK